MVDMLKILITSAIVDNVVFIQYLAICPFIGMTSDTGKAAGMGIATSFVIILATAVTWPIYKLVMVPLGLQFLQTLFFILVIASLVQLVEFFLKKTIPALYKSMGVYLALITTNCAVLGVALLSVQNDYGILASTINGIGASVGFFLAIVLMAGIREKLENSNIPEAFKGTPIVLITAGLMAIAFCGFGGVSF